MRIERGEHWDPQRTWPVARCSQCGRELYPGEPRWYSWGRTLCQECACILVREAETGEVMG